MRNASAVDARFRIEMLGRFVVWQGGREIRRFRTQKTGSLLAWLALSSSRVHPRDILIEQFWPDSDLKAARTNLSVALNALRRQLEPPGVPSGAVIVADHSQVHLNRIAFTTDVEEFERALRRAQSEPDPVARLELWMRAADLYCGDLLPGHYDDWVLTERDRLRDVYLAALRRAAKEFAQCGETERAIECARWLVQGDPLEEESHRTLMRLFVAAGRPHDAKRQYQDLERVLRDELQTVPSTATRVLADSLRHLASVARTAREATAADSPPGRSPSNLPAEMRSAGLRVPLQFTRFFGRRDEIACVAERLDPAATPPCRLVTLTGAGGMGKTRLSIEVAERVRAAFPGGLWFVTLGEMDDPLRLGEVLREMLRDALKLPRRQTDSPALDEVIGLLNDQDGPSLLILDNFEQITAGGAPVIWTLLSRVAALRCLVTSRRPLSLPGEQEIPISPLPTPDSGDGTMPETLIACPSVALFVDRAQAVRPEFQMTVNNAGAIVAICEKLEGIPLAIELAAARARALTPAQMVERLAERFELLASRRADKGERHRSLWAALDWSYHLLPPDLRRLFARLSVFRGGWTLEAAEAVAGRQEPEPRNMLDDLAQLRGHSLVQAAESSAAIRFGMLETLREFAAEQLAPEDRREIERCRADYLRQWVGGAQLSGAARVAWFARFEEDFDNLRAALAWSLQEGNDIEIGLQTASALASFWWLRGHLSEGRGWFSRLLERAGEPPTVGQSRSLQIAGTLAYLQGDFPTATSLLEQCIPAAERSGNPAALRIACETLGSIAYRRGDYAQARARYETALAQARAQGIRRNVASALGNLANVAQSTGDFDASRALNAESLEIWRAEGERNGEARTLHNLANLAQSQGRFAQARALYEQSLAIKRELADRFGMSGTLRGIADVAFAQGDYAAAAAHARESLSVARELNARTCLVEALRVLTDLAGAVGKPEVAAQAAGALEQIREEMKYPLPPVDRDGYEHAQTALRDSLGIASYDAAKMAGSALSLEQALALLEETLASRSL